MGSLTETLRLVIDGTSKGAQKALGDLETKSKTTDKTLGSFGANMNKAANYAAGAAAVLTGVIVKSVATLEKQGAGIAALKRQIDITTEGASILSGEFQRYGIDAQAGGVGIKKMLQSIDEARNGSETAAAVFERLGISVDQLKSMSDTEAILATRDALAEMGSGADRTNMAVKLLGRGALGMSAWYAASSKDMAKTNQNLKDSGMVWSDEDLADYKKAMQAQREMQIALTGIQVTIARDVLPALTPLIQQFGALLRTLRPYMGIIVPLTGGLWAFSGAVKGVRLIRLITGLGRTQGGMLGLYGVLRNGQALAVARTGFAKLTTLVKNLPALLTSTGGMYGLVAAGIAVDTVLIYEAVKAWQQMKDAVDQANRAYQNAKAQMAGLTPGQVAGFDRLAAQGRGESAADIAAAIERDKFKYSWWMGPGAWLQNSGVNVPGLANEGYVPPTPGGRIVRVAEGGEGEFVLKASRFAKGNADKGSVLVTGNTFVGTSRDAERTLTNIVSRRLGPQTARLERGRMAMASG